MFKEGDFLSFQEYSLMRSEMREGKEREKEKERRGKEER